MIAVELIQLRQPEIVARVVRVGSVARVESQVAKELHHVGGPISAEASALFSAMVLT